MTDPIKSDRRAPDPKAAEPRAAIGRGAWILLAALFALAAFMYVSIMIKIIKYGP